MGISMKAAELVSSGECINCFQCISACPRKNISVAVSEQDLRPVVAGVVAVTVITGTYYAGSLASNSDYISYGASAAITEQTADHSTTAASNDAPAAQAVNVYADGTYEGTGTGFRGGQTTVSVTIQNDTITDVQVVSYEDDAPFFDRAVNPVISQILSSQSTQVNAVSGATYSSNGIMAAVADALNAAGNA